MKTEPPRSVGGRRYDDLPMPSEAEERAGTVCRPAEESKRPPCDACGSPMEPEHAHHKCPSCGYILPCCGW